MALIRKISKETQTRTSVHDEVEARYTTFVANDGKKYFQINTFGRPSRENPGKTSQSIQFGPEAIEKLKELLQQF